MYFPSSSLYSDSNTMRTEPIDEMKPVIEKGARELSNEGPNIENSEKMAENELL